MTRVQPLPAELLCRRCDPSQFTFTTTDELDRLDGLLGQERALEALEFGLGMDFEGYNLFALGAAGVGKHHTIRGYLERVARARPPADDWCYVHNFDNPARPRALRLPAGRACAFRDDMAALVDEMGAAVELAMQSDEVRGRQQTIEEDFKRRQDEAFDSVQERAREYDIALIRTPAGVVMAPVQDDEVLGPAEFQNLPAPERERYEAHLQELHQQLEESLHRMPEWERESRQQSRALRQEVVRGAIGALLEELRRRYEDVPDVLEHLGLVERDIVENLGQSLRAEGEDEDAAAMTMSPEQLLGLSFQRSRMEPDPGRHRYGVNVLVDNDPTNGTPVVYENYPTLENLIGRIEHEAQFGALSTDYSLIRPGALHRANGGYLVLDARKVLMQPFVWEQLKRALFAGEVRIESAGQIMGAVSTVSLEPRPVPLDVKVILIGERLMYYLLSELDTDFDELFKVAVDFEDEMDRDRATQHRYAQFIATLARDEGLLPLEREAVARVIEQGARHADDAEKLTTHREHIGNLLRESNLWAQRDGGETIAAGHVERALEARDHRHGRLRDRVLEAIERGTFLIDTRGERVGQVNGLSVLQMGQFRFGRPSRITASMRMGRGEVLDIEREVALGGPLHSKGVMILSGFLGARFARDFPLALSASLVFEQSYGGVDGDSASLAETCALLSALAEVPIAQRFAITGSMDQLGQAQPIGGVNEKIEGFFDVCAARGLTGDQGVIIPAANVKHLMLDRRVVEAADRGRFRIYPVTTVDEAIELLTGLPAGKRDRRGRFPDDSVYERVEHRLAELAERARYFASRPDAGSPK